ncbi:hypothetical protein IFM47457_10143 [Aspergillus lentulus]|nr:hypothetical protein IFM47457_10143 [Aspergillus lentulus]
MYSTARQESSVTCTCGSLVESIHLSQVKVQSQDSTRGTPAVPRTGDISCDTRLSVAAAGARPGARAFVHGACPQGADRRLRRGLAACAYWSKHIGRIHQISAQTQKAIVNLRSSADISSSANELSLISADILPAAAYFGIDGS